MDLVVEGKELRTAVDKDHKKHLKLKDKLKGEIDMIKDDLHSQLKR